MRKLIQLAALTILLLGNGIKAQVTWNTFQGGSLYSFGSEVVVDQYGNIYVSGHSQSSWGSPIRPFGGGSWDGYVAKFDPNGNLLWHTFLGGAGKEWSSGVVIDPSDGSIYVSGESEGGWGSGITINPFYGGYDAFVAKLSASGNLQWVSFVGNIPVASTGVTVMNKNSFAMKLYDNNLFLTGDFAGPSVYFPPGSDWTSTAYIARMNLSGVVTGFDHIGTPASTTGFPRQWGRELYISNAGILYLAGRSDVPWNTSLWWGSPLENHHGSTDAFLAAFNMTEMFTNTPSHGMLWYTFIGSPAYDEAFGLYADDNGNVFVSGYSQQSWGSPVHSFLGIQNAFLSKYTNEGVRQWNSFVGSNGNNWYSLSCLSPGPNNTIFLSADFSSNPCISEFNTSTGALVKNIFPSCISPDGSANSVIYKDGYLYLTGECMWTWGDPVNEHSQSGLNHNMYVAKLTTCNISVSAGPDENTYFGYAPDQCVIKTAVVNGCSGPYTYNWTLDRALLPGETMTGASSENVIVCLLDTAQLSVTVTDAGGCTATDNATIFAEDVRCGNGQNQKVMICHQGTTICVDANAVSAHLTLHGDYVGLCNSFAADPGPTEDPTTEIIGTGFTVYPSPSNGNVTVSLNLPDLNVNTGTLRIINEAGQVVKRMNVSNRQKINLNLEKSGIYIAQLLIGKQVITKKLVVIR